MHVHLGLKRFVPVLAWRDYVVTRTEYSGHYCFENRYNSVDDLMAVVNFVITYSRE